MPRQRYAPRVTPRHRRLAPLATVLLCPHPFLERSQSLASHAKRDTCGGSIALLYAANAPNPSGPDALEPDITLRSEKNGRRREDYRGDKNAMMVPPWMVPPSSVRRRRIQNRTDSDRRGNCERS